MMPIHCRHSSPQENSSHQLSFNRPSLRRSNEGSNHLITPQYAPERHFEPWNLSDAPNMSVGNQINTRTMCRE